MCFEVRSVRLGGVDGPAMKLADVGVCSHSLESGLGSHTVAVVTCSQAPEPGCPAS
jgi:hypothetical protein